MEVTALNRLNAAEPAGPSLGNNSDGSFQDAIDRATEGTEKTETPEVLPEHSGSLVLSPLAIGPMSVPDRVLVKLGPAFGAAGGAPDTVLRAVRDAGDRVMSALRSANGALSVEELAAVAPSEVTVAAGGTSDTSPALTTAAARAGVSSAPVPAPVSGSEIADLPTDATSATQGPLVSALDSPNSSALEVTETVENVKDSSRMAAGEKTPAEGGKILSTTKEVAQLTETATSTDPADSHSENDGQPPGVGATSSANAGRSVGRTTLTAAGLESYSKFETAQSNWNPLWISRAAKSLSARVETSVGPITMRLERGAEGNVTDVIAPEVLRGAIERGLASDAKDLLDKDTQYKWRYVREHNEQREKPRQQESGDDNE